MRPVPFAVAAIGGVALLAFVLKGGPSAAPPDAGVRFQRITFQPGRVWSARFVPGSDTIVYAASWNDQPNRVYSARVGFPAPIDLRLPPADLLGVSRTGELALLLGRRWLQGMEPSSGVLARAGIAGSAPREMVENVTSGDWTPDGQLAAVRDTVRVRRLEFPLGRAVYETAGWIDSVRVSHDGKRVAFADHPLRSDDRGDFVVSDQSGSLTPDGKSLLFFEASEASGDEYIVGLWRAGDAAPIKIGEGHAMSLSADGKAALAIILARRVGFRILPTGVGETREVLTPALANLHWVTWLPDRPHVIVSGNEPARGSRLYVVDLAGRIIRSIGPEGTFYQTNAVSPDGARIAALDAEQRLTVYRLDDGAASIVPGVSANERPLGWSSDGSELFVLTPGLPLKVSRVNVATGARISWRDLMPSDPTGVVRVFPVLVTPDGRSYAYTYGRFLSTLYVVSGVR